MLTSVPKRLACNRMIMCLFFLIKKYPPGYHGREGFVRIRVVYPSILIFNPDLSSTLKWSSNTVICLSQRLTSVSSNSVREASCHVIL